VKCSRSTKGQASLVIPPAAEEELSRGRGGWGWGDK